MILCVGSFWIICWSDSGLMISRGLGSKFVFLQGISQCWSMVPNSRYQYSKGPVSRGPPRPIHVSAGC